MKRRVTDEVRRERNKVSSGWSEKEEEAKGKGRKIEERLAKERRGKKGIIKGRAVSLWDVLSYKFIVASDTHLSNNIPLLHHLRHFHNKKKKLTTLIFT